MKESKKELLSVIIPIYNHYNKLREAIKSILQQTKIKSCELNLEILIVNDGSTQECKEALLEIESQIKQVKLFHHENNSGPAAARNTGIREAKGEIISFLDADDLWPLDKLELLYPYLKDEDIHIIGGKIEYRVEDDSKLPEIRFQNEQNHLNHVHLGAILVRRKVFDNGLLFNTSTRYSEDVNWWLQIRENNLNILLVEEVTLIYRVHGTNMSIGKDFKELEMLQVIRQSIKRRRDNSKTHSPLPQLYDFRRFDTPLVSVVIPLFNGSQVIERAINSILAQTYKNFEIIIIDDGSTDDAVNLISQKYPFINLIRETNQGQAVARNIGIKVSNGRLIAFLDQDDAWQSDKLKEQVNVLLKNPYVGFVTCNQLIKFEAGIEVPKNYEKYLHEHRCFASSAIMIRKHILLEVSAFDKSMNGVEDLELLGRLRKVGVKELNIDKYLLTKWYDGNNMSFDIEKMRAGLFNALRKQIATNA